MDLLPYDEYAASLPRKRAAAGMLLRDHDGRVLLVEPTYKDSWELPGGTVDAEESPWATAVRETTEELGITRELGRLLVIEHIPTRGVMPEGLMFVFDGGVIPAAEVRALRPTDPEIRSVGLFTRDEVRALSRGGLHRRIEAAFRALETGSLVLCDRDTRRE
ncbi:NUDIX domain-containing protein [Actinokineospora enzanensis]|uniref:NUDIX domain-containing protein n=1 Tax=Actinokineospora enzanensis TaxID=155975 RepID=UPI0003681C69|nr:NUDIX hydrolase [Actinokineospora enzanensis]